MWRPCLRVSEALVTCFPPMPPRRLPGGRKTRQRAWRNQAGARRCETSKLLVNTWFVSGTSIVLLLREWRWIREGSKWHYQEITRSFFEVDLFFFFCRITSTLYKVFLFFVFCFFLRFNKTRPESFEPTWVRSRKFLPEKNDHQRNPKLVFFELLKISTCSISFRPTAVI